MKGKAPRIKGVQEPPPGYNESAIVIYETPSGVRVDVKLEKEAVWLNLNQMTILFDRDKSVISRHLRNVFNEKELDRNSVVAFFATTAADGKTYGVEYFNLDAVISVGYRVNSKRGTQFRIWATSVLRDHLLKGYGSVLPLGSSHIECQAAGKCGTTDCNSLEAWRVRKENGEMDPELREARDSIATNLGHGTTSTLAYAKQKLFLKDQLNEIRLIFGGGGHCDHPYKSGVLHPFSGSLFREAVIPDVVGLPTPRDMDLTDSETRWMKRLSVAYGLSFEKNELTNFTYPKDVAIPKPEEIWSRRKNIQDAPSKDEC